MIKTSYISFYQECFIQMVLLPYLALEEYMLLVHLILTLMI